MVEVIYVDNHQLVLNKPANLLTQPSGTDQLSLEQLAKEWVKTHYNKPGNVFLHAVHRLDKPVSGVVLFARTSKALSRLQAAIRDKNCTKTYIALVEGELTEEEKTLEHYLIHDSHHTTVSSADNPEAKVAMLHYKVLEIRKNCCLVQISLETGRYHQIRAQFAAIKHPILGDTRYGSQITFLPDTIALHHACLTIPHPITESMQTFEARLPEYFNNLEL